MVRGNLTLLQATAITDRWGTTHDGRLSGLLAAPAHTAAALAPFAGAALAVPLGGYGPLFFLLAAVSVAAALLAPWTSTDAIRHCPRAVTTAKSPAGTGEPALIPIFNPGATRGFNG